jgi:DNA-binding CsgD family transcriptional regulator/tetratricopeptide (TPR) repeat protein
MTAISPAPAGLVGRTAELGVLFDLVDRVRESDRARALVVRGDPGIGKTSLLTAASHRATDRGGRVLTTAGTQSEAGLPYSGLHQLLLPLLAGTVSSPRRSGAADGVPRVSSSMPDRLERLPERQRDALACALGLGAEAAPDRFLVCLAVLTLLSEEAEDRPLFCAIDDAQWLDQPSAQTVAFVARRLSAESVVLLFAASEPRDELRGLPELTVEGLRDADALELLGSVVPGRLDERVRERILAETRGNPLALLELPRGVSPAQLAGGFGMPTAISDAGSLSRRIEESFLWRIETLPPDTQELLLVAAAEPVGDPALLWRAADQLGIAYEALAPPAAAELIEIGDRVRFRHPLVRSAVYRAASLDDRRNAHRALADVTDPDVDPDRRAWHRAEAVAAPDEEVALELERSAARAHARAGLAAAAAFLERAVRLTVDPALRTRRALAAARAKFEAAAPDEAAKLLATAEMGPLDELERARVERLRALIAFARTGSADVPGLTIGPRAPALLLDAAKRLEPLDVELARETYLEAITAGMCTGSTSGDCGVRAVAEAARQAPRGPEPPRHIDVLLDSLVTRFTEPYATALPPLRRALHALAETEGRGEDNPRWLWFACPIAPEPLALDLWDDEKWHELATRAVRICRDAGALAVLPQALTYRASMHVLAGEFAAASALIDEAYAIAEATGTAPLRYPSMLLAAWRGNEAEALDVIDECVDDAQARGLERTLGMSQCLTALLYNGLGRYQDALAAAQRARAYFPTDDLDDLGPPGWALIELVEAAVRSDSREVASDALRQLAERTRASGTEWALGIEARSRALLSEGETAERLYQEAIARLDRTRIRVELPRARLHYGEWLRREHRRVDAREQLRRAHDAFTSMGADAFAERTRRELIATGETLRKRRAETRDELTPQEGQIARLARDGLTNPEIAAKLFLSTRTVEWHLYKVFAKLGIGSRMGLHAALPTKDREAAPA